MRLNFRNRKSSLHRQSLSETKKAKDQLHQARPGSVNELRGPPPPRPPTRSCPQCTAQHHPSALFLGPRVLLRSHRPLVQRLHVPPPDVLHSVHFRLLPGGDQHKARDARLVAVPPQLLGVLRQRAPVGRGTRHTAERGAGKVRRVTRNAQE